MPNQTIHQAGYFQSLELPAASSILPGMLIEEIAAGTLQPHSTAGGFAERMFAQEDSYIGNTILTAYSAGSPVRAYIELAGSKGQAILAPTYAYTRGMKLISNGDGTLKPTTGTPSSTIAIVIDPIDLSAGGAVATLASVRYL